MPDAVVVVRVDPADPVFAGHYPGFPIFPGLSVVEYVHRIALAAPPDGVAGLELVAIDSTRFLSPVFPGDELTVELDWSTHDAEWRCSAEVRTARGRTIQTRLRYRAGDGRP